jgi:hypothetical protein
MNGADRHIEANCSCDQPKSALAALIWRIDTFNIDFGAIKAANNGVGRTYHIDIALQM